MTRLRLVATAATAVLLVACGGGGGDNGGNITAGGGNNNPPTTTPNPPAPLPTTGTVGLFLTDKPSEQFAEININVTEAVLIGDGGQRSIFQGSRKINLLDLTNYTEALIFGDVDAGRYTKIRLYIDELQLVPHDRGAAIYPKLPANGKIDLLDQGGFDVVAGETIIVEIDLDADKSIKIVSAGKSDKVNFRPVVKVEVKTGGKMPDKLGRFAGIVTELAIQPPDRFVACVAGMPDNCADVRVNANTRYFDADGLPADYAALAVNGPVVVVGRYELDPKALLRALVVQVGGTPEQISGTVLSNPSSGEFLLRRINGDEVRVEIQTGTRFFDAAGPIPLNSIAVGASVEIEGVFPAQVNTQPALFRAALIFLESADSQQLSGAVIQPLDAAKASFGLSTDNGDTCVRLDEDADVVLVDTANAELSAGTFDNIELGQAVDVFGEVAADGCIVADEAIIELE